MHKKKCTIFQIICVVELLECTSVIQKNYHSLPSPSVRQNGVPEVIQRVDFFLPPPNMANLPGIIGISCGIGVAQVVVVVLENTTFSLMVTYGVKGEARAIAQKLKCLCARTHTHTQVLFLGLYSQSVEII